MKIGIFCTNNYPYPLPKGIIYASMQIAACLAEGLHERGEDVTFFASEGTHVSCPTETFDLPSFDSLNGKYGNEASYAYEDLMFSKILERADQFDIIHSHTRPFSILPEFELLKHKGLVQTVHDPLSFPAYDLLKYYDTKKIHFVSITDAQRKTNEHVDWYATVYNGVDTAKWEFNDKPSDYFLWTGRIMREKGTHNAIAIAEKFGLKLKIVGQIYLGKPESKKYFDTEITPHLSDKIEYIPTVSQKDLSDLYRNAIAYLYPFEWNEPFGLTMVESMMCGTPVLTMNHGSAPELVKDGVSGIRTNTLPELEARLGEVKNINRRECRDYAVNTFSKQHMVERYYNLYKKILAE